MTRKPGASNTFTTTYRGACPFCGRMWETVEDGNGVPAVLHEEPLCAQYIQAEDALEFATMVRKEMEKNLS